MLAQLTSFLVTVAENTMPLAPPTIRIQTILYGHRLRHLEPLLRGIEASVALASGSGSAQVSLVFGDCSPSPVLSDTDVAAIDAKLRAAGTVSFDYRFFGSNLGHAGGQNRLFADLSHDFVLVLNPDTCPSPTLLVELLKNADAATMGIIEARQLPLEHPKAYDPRTGDTSWATGACMLVRSEVVQAVEGFDARNFFMYCDDVDFSWRARLAGWRVAHRPTARVFHDKRLQLNGKPRASDAEAYYAIEADLLLAWKYSRPDLVAARLEAFARALTPQHARAVQEFRQRELRGDLPTPIDSEAEVAEFIATGYGRQRFDYASA